MNDQPTSQAAPYPERQESLQQPEHLGVLKAIHVAITLVIIMVIAVPIIYVANLSVYESVNEDDARAYCTREYSKNYKRSNKYDDCYENYLRSDMSSRDVGSVITELMGASAVIFVCLIAFILQMVARTKVKKIIEANSPDVTAIKALQVAIIVIGLIVFLFNFITLNMTQCLDRCMVNTITSVFTDSIMRVNNLAGIITNICLILLYAMVTLIMPAIILSMANKSKK